MKALTLFAAVLLSASVDQAFADCGPYRTDCVSYQGTSMSYSDYNQRLSDQRQQQDLDDRINRLESERQRDIQNSGGVFADPYKPRF